MSSLSISTAGINIDEILYNSSWPWERGVLSKLHPVEVLQLSPNLFVVSHYLY